MESPLWIANRFPIISLALPGGRSLVEVSSSRSLAWAIVESLREPVVVLDHALKVVAASAAFYRDFAVDRADAEDRPLTRLSNGQWNKQEVQALLATAALRSDPPDICEVEIDVVGRGRRELRLHARRVTPPGELRQFILLAIDDLTEQHATETRAALELQRLEMLLLEAQHRIANSLSVIASILLLKARSVQSDETRKDLQDAHRRILSVATVQKQLQVARNGAPIALAPYLTQLCRTLNASLVGEGPAIRVEARVGRGTASATEAVSIGLIVTELVINCLKHAFPADRAEGLIVVAYDQVGNTWRLAVSDNGIGTGTDRSKKIVPGLGTSIIEALARQLDSRVKIAREAQGTTVSLTHGSFAAPAPLAALAHID